MRKTFVVATVAALTGSAAADPGTFTLDRQDAQSRVGGEISYLLADGDGTYLRFDLHGQYVMPSGFGFYAALPLAYADIEGLDDSLTGIGNVDAGAIFIPRLSNPEVSLPIHIGVTLPTASDDEDGLANIAAANARITDIALAIPEGFVLRAGVSPTFRSGQFFLKADGGFDLTLSQAGDNTDPLIRLNAAAGVDLGNVSFAGEFVTVITTNDDADDQVLNTLALGVRGVAGNVRPYGGVMVPIDVDGLDAVFTAGLEGVIQ